MTNTFCPIPWNFQAIRNNGDVRICCQANVSANKGVVRHDNGKPFNAATDSLNEARNATLMKQVRKNMINGAWSDECRRCKEEEAAGLASRRIYESAKWGLTLDQVLPFTDINGSIDTESMPVVYYDLRFGNLCNLACRMCGPEDSITWYEQWSKFTGSESFDDTHGKVILIRNEVGRLTTSDYDWHGSDLFWNQIENNMQYIQKIYMAGGEPLLIDRHYEFLNKSVLNGTAKNIELEYNTNGTTLPSKVFELWKHFKHVGLGVSVDGVGSVVEYQRWPIKWIQLEKNLYKLNHIMSTTENISAWFAVTVTAYNVFHISDMVEWKISNQHVDRFNSGTINPIISIHMAHKPETVNVRILPIELKIIVQEKYAASIATLRSVNTDPFLISKAEVIYNSIIKYMLAEDWNLVWFEKFITFTEFLDKERHQYIGDIVPELIPYVSKEK